MFLADLLGTHKTDVLIIVGTFVLGMVVHFPVYANPLYNPDTLGCTDYYRAGSWEFELGRWGLPPLDLLFGGAVPPALAVGVSLVLLLVASLVLCDALHVEDVRLRALACCLITTSPYVANTLTYHYCTQAYALSYLLAVLFVRGMEREGGSRVLAGLSLVLALSIYQTAANVALVGMAFALVLFPVARREAQDVRISRLFLALGCFAVACVVYYAVSFAALRVLNLQFDSYGGADSVGAASILGNLPQNVVRLYQQLARFVAGTSVVRNAFRIKWTNIVLFAGAALLLVHRVFTQEAKVKGLVLVAVMALLIPLGCDFVSLVSMPSRLAYRIMSGHYLTVCCVALLFANMALSSDLIAEGRPANLVERRVQATGALALAMVAYLVWGYCSQVSLDYQVMENKQKETLALTERILASVDQYRLSTGAESPLIIVGHPERGTYSFDVNGQDAVDRFALQTLFWDIDETMSGSWRAIGSNFFGARICYVTGGDYASLASTEAVRSMPCYPYQGSIAEVDGNLVVKVADLA